MNKEQIPLTNLCKEILDDIDILTNVFTGNKNIFPRMLTGIDELDVSLGKTYGVEGIHYGSLNLFFTDSSNPGFYFETILESINKYSPNIYLQGNVKYEFRSLDAILESVKNFDKENKILAFNYVGNLRSDTINSKDYSSLVEIKRIALDKRLIIIMFAIDKDGGDHRLYMEQADNTFKLTTIINPTLEKYVNCVKIDVLKTRQGTRGFSCKYLF